jgi:hypothetical protein
MSKWISVKYMLPEHNQIVLTFSRLTISGKAGFGVAVFVDSVKMNETLRITGYGNEAVDISIHPYYFVSQEVKQHTYKHVTHWMPLPEPPKNE